ncbi:ATP synthase epsilon chain [Mycoplasmopsis bovigenitalium]|uniref:ATP synthase epsilon chain n=2 Tax=Mycoplasmopsis bovigenitalium TaxID=2112 RepID=N9TV72_9BACT|nr:ATP synthase epsilon chain [Mycoplasmopsis bovigenitalium]ENY70029.1 ATP synthase epsilon chain [Mycoplasmopsis bovigenitalium 51080]VEU60635.1 ATP synthase epsilon chain [Mycoplasmopsis bovigenitalium]
MNKLHLTISTPDGIFLEEYINSISVKTIDSGAITFLYGHGAFMGSLAIDKLTINNPGDDNYRVCVIGGGLIYTDGYELKIITNDITLKESINIDETQSRRNKILDQLKFASKKDAISLENQLRKIILKINIYNEK